jgi:hypothetical protein
MMSDCNVSKYLKTYKLHVHYYFLKYLKKKTCIELNGKFLRFRRDGVSISYTVICLSHFDVRLAIT